VSDDPIANDLFDDQCLDEHVSIWKRRIESARLAEVDRSDRRNKHQFLAYFSEADAQLEFRLWDLPPVEELCKRLDVGACPCLLSHFNYFAALCCENGVLTRNDYVDAGRVSVAPYVDVFTCDRPVADRLRKTGFAARGTAVCTCPEDVLDICS